MKSSKALLYSVLIVISQTTIYEIGKLVCAYKTHIINIPLDDKIPFISFFIIFYISWYLLIVLIPYLLAKKDQKTFKEYALTIIISFLLTLPIFIFFPTEIIRNPSLGNTIFDKIIEILYYIDEPTTCLPSFHASSCFIIIFYIIKTNNIKRIAKVVIVALSILIILSTLFIDQHVILDVVASLIIVTIAIIISKTIKKNKCRNL